MTNLAPGVDFTLFTGIIDTYGDIVVRTPVTKTESNIEGDETLNDGTPENIQGYLSRKTAPWMFDKPGLIQGGDAILLVYPTQTINKNDKITHNNVTYRVQQTLNRDQIGGVVAYISCNLFKIE